MNWIAALNGVGGALVLAAVLLVMAAAVMGIEEEHRGMPTRLLIWAFVAGVVGGFLLGGTS